MLAPKSATLCLCSIEGGFKGIYSRNTAFSFSCSCAVFKQTHRRRWQNKAGTDLSSGSLFWHVVLSNTEEECNVPADTSCSRFGGGRLGTDGGNILLTNESHSELVLVWWKRTSSVTQMLWTQSNMSNQEAARSEPLTMTTSVSSFFFFLNRAQVKNTYMPLW